MESQIFYDEANASTRKHKFGKQYSLNTLKEDAKTKKSSFGYLAENFNLRDLKNQIEEKILNIGQEADKETQYKIFLCMIFFLFHWNFFYKPSFSFIRSAKKETTRNISEPNRK